MKTIRHILLLAMSLSLGLGFVQAQSKIHPSVAHNESCQLHDGALTVIIDAPLNSETNVRWEGPSITAGNATSLSPSGLDHGTYTLQVYANDCPSTPIYTKVLTIEKEDCEPKASISVHVNRVPCGVDPTANLHASAHGGVPPYTLSWTDMTVSSSGRYSVTVTDATGQTGEGHTYVYLKRIECSSDPNEIEGPSQYDDSLHYVALNRDMRYRIFFENDPGFATAPASMVRVTYPIPEQQNLSSFRLSGFGFGSFDFTVPNNVVTYTQRLDLSDSLGVWVDVTAGIDVSNRQAFWVFQSIDPETGFEPANSQLGFLLVNDSLGHGEGYVDFTIRPNQSLHSGDTVSVDATIVFDDNAPIPTNVWHNTFDAVAPTSTLQLVRANANDDHCTITLSAVDDLQGSGVASIELLVSENNAPFYSHSSHRADSAFVFNMTEGVRYRFASRATDNVGNQESPNLENDTVIDNNTAPSDLYLTNDIFYENADLGTLVGEFTTLDNDITLPFVYQLVAGAESADNALFEIRDNRLVTAADFRCLGRYQFQVRVRTTDISGLYFEKSFTLNMIQQQYTKTYDFGEYICQGHTYSYHSHTFNSDTVLVDTIPSYLGCDSIVRMHLFVKPHHLIESSELACGSTAYTWQGHPNVVVDTTYGVQILVDTLRSRFGCDSIHRLTLQLWPSSLQQETAAQCDSYTWKGQLLTQSGSYRDSLTNQYGCDSITTLHLTLWHSTVDMLTAAACDSYSWRGTTHTASGLYSETLSSAHGCDSVLCLALTLWPSSAETLHVTACDSYELGDVTYTQSALIVDTLHTVHQCDSIVTLNLTVDHGSSETISATVCDSYEWHGTTYTSSDMIDFTTLNAAGCDSVVTLNLTVNYSSVDTEEATACDSYSWHGVTYTQSIVVADTLPSGQQCDSIVTLDLTINHSSAATVSATACDSYEWDDELYTQSATIVDTLETEQQCDSVVTIFLTVNASSTENISVTVCDSYEWQGTTYTDSEEIEFTTLNAAGCDSVVTLNLTVNYSSNETEEATACDSYEWDDMTLTQGGHYSHSYTTQEGCDSVMSLDLTLSYSSSESHVASACDEWEWNGNIYTESGEFAETFSTEQGCDSVVTYLLTIHYSVTEEIDIEATEHYEWNGESYTESGSYTWTGTTSEGCDSTVVLNLTILTEGGIDEIISGEYTMQIYPNPAANSTTISIAGVEGEVVITVLDNAGHIVARDMIVCSADCFKELDVTGLATGIYYVQVHAPGFNQVRKLVVK